MSFKGTHTLIPVDSDSLECDDNTYICHSIVIVFSHFHSFRYLFTICLFFLSQLLDETKIYIKLQTHGI